MLDSNANTAGNVSSVDGSTPTDSHAALRRVVQFTLRTDLRRILGGCPIEQSGLRENLRTIAAHARSHRLSPERLLVLIKEVNLTLPEAMELRARPDLTGTLDRLITIAIDEYFGPPPPSA